LSVRSASRALELLALVAQQQLTGRAITQASLRRDTGLPRSSLHALLDSLIEARYIESVDNAYRVGMRAYEVGNVWAASIDVVRVSQPVLAALVGEHGHTANLAILDGHDVVYLLKHDSPRPIRLVSAQGKRLPAHSTALGKALLSALDDDELRALYEGHDLERVTDHTIDHFDELLRQVQRARQTGVATENGESTPGVHCWATTIRDASGRSVGAVSLSAIALPDEPVREEEIVEALREASQAISFGMGYRA
jgi:IclR family KDG regulon transcriptional repressor